ncbi:hypothetical protein LX64_04803 [Chitinophaga skermanii]|uniref:ArsR family transcriptional regulator n=2 Tax=Chitinophaga skermanii TaxID=331697 RepID=A0A327Q3Y0_9BACT|nr:hypothetical protein LX64_04803 [Chitinophaga skermanii]
MMAKKTVDTKHTIPVKLCYSHIGGKLGMRIFEHFEQQGWIVRDESTEKHYKLTPLGEQALAKLGVDLEGIT